MPAYIQLDGPGDQGKSLNGLLHNHLGGRLHYGQQIVGIAINGRMFLFAEIEDVELVIAGTPVLNLADKACRHCDQLYDSPHRRTCQKFDATAKARPLVKAADVD